MLIKIEVPVLSGAGAMRERNEARRDICDKTEIYSKINIQQSINHSIL